MVRSVLACVLPLGSPAFDLCSQYSLFNTLFNPLLGHQFKTVKQRFAKICREPLVRQNKNKNKNSLWNTQARVLLAAPLWEPAIPASSPLILIKNKTNLNQSIQNLPLRASNFTDLPGLQMIQHFLFLSATPATNMPKPSLQIPRIWINFTSDI